PDNGKRYNIFGTGGVQKQAREMNVPVLGELPINMAIRERGDAGTMAGVYEEADSAPYLDQICMNLARNVSDAAKSAPSLPTL
ncbi:MAG TPA: P-loop NTPase, partial [Pirellulales bacterium]